MSRRKRWRNVKGTGSRVTETRERLVVGAASVLARAVAPFLPTPADTPAPPREVLVLRLDRIGDVLMSLPAIGELRKALPNAKIRLAVGQWARDIAQDAPVDEVLVWSAPWVGRRDEGAGSIKELFLAAWSRRSTPPDLAIDLQGDLRAMWLMAATGARSRVGYANTGSASLLTHIVELDENLNFVEQNRRAVETAIGRSVERTPFTWISDARRSRGRSRLNTLLTEAALVVRGPIIGLHPGAGRSIKEWPIERFVELGKRLVEERSATLVLTGSESEKPKAKPIREALRHSTLDLTGRLDLTSFAEVMSALDGFVSCDTSAMHFACALGVPSVTIFGPSDPGRYFSGGSFGFGAGNRHRALTNELWCRPCNLIRRPPEECEATPVPDCLSLVSTDLVLAATLEVVGPTP
jgi:ADP-heptose:LPS heptosyltransferase